MAQSTAWSCLFLGSSLLRHGSRPLEGRGRGLALALVILTTVFGFLNFLEYFIGVDLSLEEVLFPATEQFGRVVTNRMSPMTGAGMFISGIALFLVLRPRHPIRNLSGVLGLLVAMLGLVGTMGYLFGTPLLYGGDVIPMAATTTCRLPGVGNWAHGGGGPGVLAPAGAGGRLGPGQAAPDLFASDRGHCSGPGVAEPDHSRLRL